MILYSTESGGNFGANLWRRVEPADGAGVRDAGEGVAHQPALPGRRLCASLAASLPHRARHTADAASEVCQFQNDQRLVPTDCIDPLVLQTTTDLPLYSSVYTKAMW